jgi:pyruvate/2-oxoglutarate dehydrogenase complex dihydrolipoamide dehydrogenase (E3) component
MSEHYQVIVIGSGSGGKDAAMLAARAGLRVLVVEKQSLGGTCFHRGCNAIRALRACAMHYGAAEGSSRFGLSVDPLETGWTDWIGTQRRVSARLTEDLSRTLESLGIQIRFGTARFLNPNEVEISDPYGARDRVSGQNIIIATGSRPAFSSVKDSKILNSDQMLKNVEVPAYLLIIGGGYIGCEFASIYRTLGARVTLVEEKDDLLPSWDSVAGDQIWDSLEKQGVTIILKEKVDLPAPETWTNRPVFTLGNGTIVSPDLTLIATGRKPNVEELGLDDRSVVDPEPIKIRLVIQPETTTLLGCQAVGAKAAEIVNLAAAALSTGLSVTQLADLAMVHPSASEALVRCLQGRFDRHARSTPST